MDQLLQSPLLWTCGSGVGVFLLHAAVKEFRVSSFRAIARQRIKPDAGEAQGILHQMEALTKDRVTQAELATYGTVTAAEFLWSWATVDPSVIKAAAFASGQHIANGLDFAHYIHHYYDSLPAVAKEGFLNRLLGYVGEQQVADILTSQGHTVEVAGSAAQPIWDLLVDGQMANVKTVSQLAAVKAQALIHPDVTYLVPEDAHGTVGGNIARVAGFSHSGAKEALKQGVLSAKGESALHSLTHHIPWITIGFATYRNVQAVRAGKDPKRAAVHTVMESVGRGTGVVAGGKIGGLIGGVFGPVGALVGAVGGGIAGAMVGGAIAEEWKQKPLRQAVAGLETALHTFGKSFEHRLEDVQDYIRAPYRRMCRSVEDLKQQVERRKSTFRWWFWPDFYTVLLEEAMLQGQEQARKEREAIRPALETIRHAQATGHFERFGLLMANSPVVCELVGFDGALLKAIEKAQGKVFFERKQLDPKFTPPAGLGEAAKSTGHKPPSRSPRPRVSSAASSAAASSVAICYHCQGSVATWATQINGVSCCGFCRNPYP